MALGTGLVIGGAALLGLGLLALSDSDDSSVAPREVWLINGARYSLLIYSPQTPDMQSLASQLMSMGFCEPTNIQLLPPGGTFQVQALWCQQNTLWQVPENIAVSQV